MKTFFLIGTILLFSVNLLASGLSPAAQLHKLSWHLRGVPPTLAEMKELSTIPSGEKQNYIQEKIKSYQGSRAYQLKMTQRLDELFRVRVNRQYLVDDSSGKEAIEYGGTIFDSVVQGSNALSDLFNEIVSQNLSWDNLLLKKDYRIFKSIFSTNEVDEPLFYEDVFEDQIKAFLNGFDQDNQPSGDDDTPPNISLNHETVEQAQVLAGAITTPRFFSRYQTTKINKNRRRAAAIFRIFLCDPMTPALREDPDGDLLLLKEVLGISDLEGDKVHGKELKTEEERHGTDPMCLACHYKLDPAAKTMQTSSVVLSRDPAPGALVYKKKNGEMVNINVNNISELAQAISQQEEYVSCQVSHFWNWFVGQNYPLTTEMKAELVDKFNQVNRRPNDFVRYLVNRPEFLKSPRETAIKVNSTSVETVFKKCNSCHMWEGNAPSSLTELPIGGSLESHFKTIKSVSKALDLAHDGKDREMPESGAGWDLEPLDVQLIKAYIARGTPDENNKPLLTEEQVQEITESWINPADKEINPLSIPGFGNSFRRYLTNNELYGLWYKKFKWRAGYSDTLCGSDSSNAEGMLGVKSRISGKPNFEHSNPGFFSWFKQCSYIVTKYILIDYPDYESLGPKIISREYKVYKQGQNQYGYDDETTDGAYLAQLAVEKWVELPAEIKWSVASKIYDWIYGESLFSDDDKKEIVSSAMRGADKYLSMNQNEADEAISAMRGIHLLIYYMASREEFITY